MAKRGENIYKRKDGRYEGRYIKGRHLNGKPLFGYVYAYTYAEVKHLLTLKKASARHTESIPIIGKGNLAEFLRYWLEKVAKEQIKTSSYAQYYERIEKYIIPALGNIPISKLNNRHIQDFIDTLSQKGLSASTIINIIRLLRSSMKKAKELHIIHINPCDGLVLPKKEIKERRVLDRTEQIKLEQIAMISGKNVELAIFLSLYAGLRIGEICALRWKDIDLSSRTLTVRGTLQRMKCFDGTKKTIIIVGTPKSRQSLRHIPLPKGLSERLGMQGISLPNSEECYVLTGTLKPPEPRTLRSQFKRAAAKVGLDISFHTLRHTFATRCLEHNFDIQTLSELLGHASANTTMSIYSHSVLEHKRLLTERIHILSEEFKPSIEPSDKFTTD